MGIDTPNVLSRETTFLMGILKKCLPVEKVPIEEIHPQVVQEIDANNSILISDPTPGHSGHSVPSTEGVFCHSVLPTEEESPRSFSSVHRREISDELCQHPGYG